MGIRFDSVATTETFFKYPSVALMGIYATPYFRDIQHELRDYKWTYLLVGSQYLAQRWREVRLNNDIMRLQHYILHIVGQKKRPPRTALRALHATYKRLRRVYALRPESQRIRMLEHWRTATIPALALMYLSDESDMKFKAPLQLSVNEASRLIEEYRAQHPGPAIVLPAILYPEPEPILSKYSTYPETRYANSRNTDSRYPDPKDQRERDYTPRYPEPEYPELKMPEMRYPDPRFARRSDRDPDRRSDRDD